MKEKQIRYPDQEWLEVWIDKYLDQHPNERIENMDEINEKAVGAWWDNEIEHDRPTPFDLTPEEAKESKKARMGAKSEHVFVKRKEPVKRERKPNQVKRDVIDAIQNFCINAGYADVKVENIEREICFKVGDKSYSLTLIEHRPPKAEA